MVCFCLHCWLLWGCTFLSQDWDMLAPLASAKSAHVRGGAFDFVFILTVWIDARLDVGDDKRGGHHNKTCFLITKHPAGYCESSQRLLKTSITSGGQAVVESLSLPSPLTTDDHSCAEHGSKATVTKLYSPLLWKNCVFLPPTQSLLFSHIQNSKPVTSYWFPQKESQIQRSVIPRGKAELLQQQHSVPGLLCTSEFLSLFVGLFSQHCQHCVVKQKSLSDIKNML